MKTSAVTPADLSGSVVSVPPLARTPDLALDRAANRRLIRHIEQGGVTTLLYGGNANFYNIGMYEFASVLDMLEESAAADSWVVPSIGPDFGKMMDQADVLRSRKFPTAMVMPPSPPLTQAGVEAGIRRVAERYGKPLIVYIKGEAQIAPEGVERLDRAGVLASVKYAIPRPDASDDPYLSKLVGLIERKRIVSGMGERPALAHVRDFGLAGFTSGCVSIAPKSSQAMLRAMQRRDWTAAEQLRQRFVALEDFRESVSFITVLHEAVTLSGIADMGAVLPLLSNLDAKHRSTVQKLVDTLLASERQESARAA
jgi:dihydrodipicolinate synthase/N-acetylneuraminate lyase